MIPIVTPVEMNAIDAAASETVDVLIDRAGAAVARAARSMMGGTYGRVVNVIAGQGNNGGDGRAAGARLAGDGVTVRVFDAATCPASLPPSDLVIDAAYGTGFRGEWSAPDIGGAPVLAVDIPSGVNGLTGAAADGVLAADRTITFAALKPGLLFDDGKHLAGRVELADIALDVSSATAHVVELADVAGWWRPLPATSHKWSRAVRIVAGSPGLTGAAALSSGAAIRAGAGIVWLSIPGAGGEASHVPVEVVGRSCPATGWGTSIDRDLDRFHAMVIGPGLGREETTVTDVGDALASAAVPLVIDGDGLYAIANTPGGTGSLRRRRAPTVVTPHDGEVRLLTGSPPGPDRIAAARLMASEWSVVVLLKGPSTVVAEPGGAVRVVADGDQRLATAGTGDVLSGILAALLAAGLDPFDAAAGAAWIHAAAAMALPPAGLVASDLLTAVPGVLDVLS